MSQQDGDSAYWLNIHLKGGTQITVHAPEKLAREVIGQYFDGKAWDLTAFLPFQRLSFNDTGGPMLVYRPDNVIAMQIGPLEEPKIGEQESERLEALRDWNKVAKAMIREMRRSEEWRGESE